jgi:uncharacterized cupin superfamily protein
MLTFNVFDAEMTYDPSDPEPYAAGANRFGPKIGASRLGATVYEIPPGQSLCPYHYESEEEWVLVLRGQVTVRHPDGEDVLGPGDVTAFPTGPKGAHKTTNNGTETVRMVMFSNVEPNGYCVYPDSNKVYHWTDSPDPEDSVRVRRGENLDYYDGEL